MNKHYDISIVLRACPRLGKHSVGFDDKLSMIRACARSMAVALEGMNAKIAVILDGCGQEYELIYRNAFAGFEIRFEHYDRIGNRATFQRQLDILAEEDESDVFFICEDDYLFSPFAFHEMLAAVSKPEVDFVSPLDHPDAYECGKIIFPRDIAAVSHRHWMRSQATCLTFMAKRQAFLQNLNKFGLHSKGYADCVLWCLITKIGLYSPGMFLRAFVAGCRRLVGVPVPRVLYWHIIIWKRFWWRMVVPSKSYVLWTPLPELARHLADDTVPIVKAADIESQFPSTDH